MEPKILGGVHERLLLDAREGHCNICSAPVIEDKRPREEALPANVLVCSNNAMHLINYEEGDKVIVRLT